MTEYTEQLISRLNDMCPAHRLIMLNERIDRNIRMTSMYELDSEYSRELEEQMLDLMDEIELIHVRDM